MTKLATVSTPNLPTDGRRFTAEEIDLIKTTVCRGATDVELRLFLYQAQRTGLDPLARQIYALKRWDHSRNAEVLSIQTSIDGFRLIAERTGKYRGQVGPYWCGKDGQWCDVWVSSDPPAAARVGALREDFSEPCWGVATLKSYAQKKKDGTFTKMWTTMPDVLLSKCFDEETEILTERGFRKFADVGASAVMMVSGNQLVAVEATPFVQEYSGDMVVYESDDINFCVTPNHDMITTFGKVEAGALYHTSNSFGPWRIPRIVSSTVTGGDRIATLIGYVLADGYLRNGNGWAVTVSRPYKVASLHQLGLHDRELVQHSAGQSVTVASGRTITSNFDKTIFIYPLALLSAAIDERKQVRRDFLLTCTQEQARGIIDAWQQFDGSTNKKTGVRRIYISDLERLAAFEFLSVKAGYAVSTRKERQSDVGDINYYLTISERNALPVFKRRDDSNLPSLQLIPNASGRVWCVTVPSGVIVVRRNGFSMLCGNCAESLALRKAFPQELSNLYTSDEMEQAQEAPRENPHVTRPDDIAPQIQYDIAGNPVDNIPLGDPNIKPMPVGATRADFERMQKEMYAIKDVGKLRAWGQAQKDRIQKFRESHRDIMRRLFGDYLQTLQREASPAEVRVDAETGEVLDGAPADPNPMPSPIDDPEAARAWVIAGMAKFSQYEPFEKWFNEVVAPREPEFFPPDYQDLIKLYEKVQTRLAP